MDIVSNLVPFAASRGIAVSNPPPRDIVSLSCKDMPLSFLNIAGFDRLQPQIMPPSEFDKLVTSPFYVFGCWLDLDDVNKLTLTRIDDL